MRVPFAQAKSSDTATIRTIDPGKVNGRSWHDESLLRRPKTEGSRGCTATRHVQVRGRPPVLHQPLLGQALHQTRRPRRAPYPQEGRRKTPKADELTRKLLEEDVRTRPAATVEQRRHFLRTMAGKSLSEPTLRRLMKRMGFSRKKGLWGRWNGTSGEEPLGR